MFSYFDILFQTHDCRNVINITASNIAALAPYCRVLLYGFAVHRHLGIVSDGALRSKEIEAQP